MEDLIDKDVIGTTTTKENIYRPVQRKSEKKILELQKSVDEYEQVKETYSQSFGEDNEKTIAISDIIAGQLFQLQRYDESLAMYISLLEHYRNTHGPCDEKSLKVNETIVLIYVMTGQSEAFLEALETLCTLYTNEMKYDVSDIGQIKMMYVNYLERERNFTTAELVLQELLSTYASLYGDTDLRSIKIDRRIAEILIQKGDYEKALTELTDIVDELEETQGHLTVDALDTRRLIANIYIKMGELDTALEMFVELFTQYMECYGGECYETLTIRTSIAATLLKRKDYEQSLNIYTAVYESYLNLPDTSPEVTTHVKHIIGHIHLKENRLHEAESIFRECLHEYKELYDNDDTHMNVAETKASLGALLLKQKKFEESRLYYTDVQQQYRLMFGEHNEKTMQIEDILIDLNELDSMLTNDDRKTIEENIRVNEANNFGSQNFEKYLLPKKSDFDQLDTRPRSVSMLTTKSMASMASIATNGTTSDSTSYPSTSIAADILHRASLPVTPKVIRPNKINKINKNTEASIIGENESLNKSDDESEEDENQIVDHTKYPKIIIKTEEEVVNTNEKQQRRPPIDDDEESESMRSGAWEDVNLNSARDSKGGRDIMADIRKQQLDNKNNKNEPINGCVKCSCCTIS